MAWGTVFTRDWWLDTVAPNAWDCIQVEREGEVVARLPYMIKKRYGFTFLGMPPLTQALGPWLSSSEERYTNQLSEEKALMTQLIEQLPPFALFRQNFHYSITNWLPFYWQGFQQTTRYTYVIEDLGDLDRVWNDTRKNIRTDIRKAQKIVAVRSDLSVDQFLELNEMTFRRQGARQPYSRELVARIDRACAERGCRRMFFAEDAQGLLHAAIYLVWDDRSAYYLMGGSDPSLRNSGAMSYLMWEAIQFAATVTQKFDFEGSMIEPVERFFRAFGGTQKAYMQVSKINSLPVRVAQDVGAWYNSLRR